VFQYFAGKGGNLRRELEQKGEAAVAKREEEMKWEMNEVKRKPKKEQVKEGNNVMNTDTE
jgi:hypothetical protein